MDFRVSVLPDAVRREDRHAAPRQVEPAARHDEARLRAEKPLDDFKKAIHKPYGMVLVTGPHRLRQDHHALLGALRAQQDRRQHLHRRGPGRVQPSPASTRCRCTRTSASTSPTALRAFLRQDPDIIMVGEIRDFETAEIAVKAALTGHLVLSTLHTNDAPVDHLAPPQHGHRALPRHRLGQPDRRPAPRAQDLPRLQASRRVERSRRSSTPGMAEEQIRARHHDKGAAARPATTPATRAASPSTR